MKGWIKVIAFTYSQEALLAKTYLEALGIDVISKDLLTIQVHPFASQAIGGAKLFVEVKNEEEALALLEDGGYIERDTSKKKVIIERFPAEYKTACPYCKETNVVRKSMGGWIFVISAILGCPLPIPRKVYYCYECQKEWKIKFDEKIEPKQLT